MGAPRNNLEHKLQSRPASARNVQPGPSDRGRARTSFAYQAWHASSSNDAPLPHWTSPRGTQNGHIRTTRATSRDATELTATPRFAGESVSRVIARTRVTLRNFHGK